jgi:hypothetical protein
MSTTDSDWEDVQVPQGSFIGWGNKPGQKMTARVLSYSDADGRDFNGEPCPQIVAELTEPFTNYRDKGETVEEIAAGEIVSITCGQANLRRTVRSAALEPGNLFQLAFTDTFKAEKGTGKIFEMKVNRSRPAGVAANDLV